MMKAFRSAVVQRNPRKKYNIYEKEESGAREKLFHVLFDVLAKYLEYMTK